MKRVPLLLSFWTFKAMPLLIAATQCATSTALNQTKSPTYPPLLAKNQAEITIQEYFFNTRFL